jgi:hypothetical protein
MISIIDWEFASVTVPEYSSENYPLYLVQTYRLAFLDRFIPFARQEIYEWQMAWRDCFSRGKRAPIWDLIIWRLSLSGPSRIHAHTNVGAQGQRRSPHHHIPRHVDEMYTVYPLRFSTNFDKERIGSSDTQCQSPGQTTAISFTRWSERLLKFVAKVSSLIAITQCSQQREKPSP